MVREMINVKEFPLKALGAYDVREIEHGETVMVDVEKMTIFIPSKHFYTVLMHYGYTVDQCIEYAMAKIMRHVKFLIYLKFEKADWDKIGMIKFPKIEEKWTD